MIKSYSLKYFYRGIYHVYNTASIKHALRKFARLDRNSNVQRLEMEVSYGEWRKTNFQD